MVGEAPVERAGLVVVGHCGSVTGVLAASVIEEVDSRAEQ